MSQHAEYAEPQDYTPLPRVCRDAVVATLQGLDDVMADQDVAYLRSKDIAARAPGDVVSHQVGKALGWLSDHPERVARDLGVPVRWDVTRWGTTSTGGTRWGVRRHE